MNKDRQNMEDWVSEQLKELTVDRGLIIDETYVKWMCRRCFSMGRASGLEATGIIGEEEE